MSPQAVTRYTYGERSEEARAAIRLANKQLVVRQARFGAQKVDGAVVVKLLRALQTAHISTANLEAATGYDRCHLNRLRIGKYGSTPKLFWTKREAFLDGVDSILGPYREALEDLASSVIRAKMSRDPGERHAKIRNTGVYRACEYAAVLATFGDRKVHPNPWDVRALPRTRKVGEPIFADFYDKILGQLETVVAERRRVVRQIEKLLEEARQ